MRETVELTGVVLLAQPVGEYDRRVVILTRERGKITAFAHGARRPKSPLIAVTTPFVFARFSLFEGRDAYTLATASAAEYFQDLVKMQPGSFYGFYFLELAMYFGQEGDEAEEMVNLVFVALKALERNAMKPELIRRVYELRMLRINGVAEIPESEKGLGEGAFYAVRYAAYAPLPRLFSFALTKDAEESFTTFVRREMRRTVDRPFKSLAVIEAIRETEQK
ncbi:MAG: DNA repair protein RecO [Lachnospiraceae bacterium]|jgi:DNA repair protein RecO (recombination protein O)|nr:DNA repair protein RecO [Lachnospiraceae bacterium]MCH4064738.1 DNA repair protein RecO [Lachnospiraceae bacterium]MCH4103713.1 DNA repair protein RecO [Lachnospiraceae bacterium]MCI1308302.1 DNA repair protein RecO [Lachnospiraceae bacterium]MCI1332907.1 DNA repair protein RecO [Lachnospiraceae bacterium]